MAGISRTLKVAELRKGLAVNGGVGFVAFPAWSAPVLTFFRRNTHESVYKKNVEDQLNATTVPDEVIKPESDKYWAPNPNTGVFGPDSGTPSSAGTIDPSAVGKNSVLEEKAWFRPTSLEDLEKASP